MLHTKAKGKAIVLVLASSLMATIAWSQVNTTTGSISTSPSTGESAGPRIQGHLAYKGGPINDLQSEFQPMAPGSSRLRSTSLWGYLEGGIAQGRKFSTLIGTEYSGVTPVQGTERFQFMNPYISGEFRIRDSGWTYTTYGKIGAVTDDSMNLKNQVGASEFRQEARYQFLSSKFQVDFKLRYWNYLYDESYAKKDGSATLSTLALYPGLRYALSDNLVLVTQPKFGWDVPRSKLKSWAYLPFEPIQKTGFKAYAFNRRWEIYPFLEFYPNKFTWNRTSVSLETYFTFL